MGIFDLFKQIESSNPSPTGPVTHIVVGLGNPGKEYTYNRHNAGFMCMDVICDKYRARVDKAKFKALVGECNIAGKHVLLMKPQTFMNNSGEAIREAADFYNVPAENIIVIFDDISIGVGKLRIRRKGSAGGHNGIKSVIEHLSTNEFPRIKLGVGEKPSPEYDLINWVLGNIPESDRKAMSEAYSSAADALEVMLSGDMDRAMNKYNS
ncbi:MAG: aminoacyl-tRNA hydrolase [Clostridia bacterium]|nr:aminoacyl-tRNA hydrolase [Clostridia bacterium]